VSVLGRWPGCCGLALAVALGQGLSLSGCTTASSKQQSANAANGQASLSGRLAIRAQRADGGINPSMSAAFELNGDENTGNLRLSSPLGTTLADANWAANGVVLSTSDGLHHYQNLDELAQTVFGQDVPLRALWHWLRGQAWPGASAQPLPGGGGFSQLGWQVDTHQLQSAGSLLAEHSGPPGQVVLRIRLDR